MAATPGALQLRLLQTVVDVAAEKNSTLVMPFAVELLRFFDRATNSAVPAAEDVLTTLATPTTATAAPLTAGIVLPDSPATLSHSNGNRSLNAQPG
jgi:hypothetical protein